MTATLCDLRLSFLKAPRDALWWRRNAIDQERSSIMPVRYERDDARRRVVVTVQGELQTRDMLTVGERPRAEETSGYGMLFDLRRMTGSATPADLRKMIDQSASSRPTDQQRGPVAIVATDPILYRVACTYAALGHAKLAIQVYRDLDEAHLWLAAW